MSSPLTPGVATCPDCGERLLCAATPVGDVLALSPDDSGPVIAYEDGEGIPRCRPAGPDEQLALGEYMFRAHDPRCPALAPVSDLAAERERRRLRPVPERRHANAR